jgi:PASTA domain-containing protein
MALRPRILLPRLGLAVLVVLLATATITFAAETHSSPVRRPAAAPAAPTLLLVPDVRRQAYVFAKTTLEESGFAWRVAGSVRGYSANLVSGQSPAPGTRVFDTGAPTIVLTLTRNSRYGEEGAPEDTSPYPGTGIRLPGAPAKPKVVPKPKPKPKAKPKPKPAMKPKTKPAVKPKTKPAVKPKPMPKPKPAPKPKAKAPAKRPPAFAVPGAKPEPLDEMPLPARATLLPAWLTEHPRPSDANVRHWLYQHAWIVTGARLGWWHGAEALETLIAVDRQVQRRWGIGRRSERVARAALAEVRRKSR